VNIERDDNTNYVLSYAPFGVDRGLGHALRLEAPGGLAYVCTRA